MNEKLRRYLRAKKDPALALVDYLSDLDENAKKMLEEVVRKNTTEGQKRIDEAVDNLTRQFPAIQGDIARQLKAYILAKPELFKGPEGRSIKGNPGPQGKPGKPGKEGKTPVKGKDYPGYSEVKEMVQNLVPSGALLIKTIIKALKKIPAEPIARSLEKLKGKQRLDYYALKNLPDIPTQNKIQETVRGVMRGGGDRVRVATLTGNGGKVFTVPKHKRALLLTGSDFPYTYKQVVDFTTSNTTLTLTAAVDAPTNGANLEFLYVE